MGPSKRPTQYLKHNYRKNNTFQGISAFTVSLADIASLFSLSKIQLEKSILSDSGVTFSCLLFGKTSVDDNWDVSRRISSPNLLPKNPKNAPTWPWAQGDVEEKPWTRSWHNVMGRMNLHRRCNEDVIDFRRNPAHVLFHILHPGIKCSYSLRR